MIGYLYGHPFIGCVPCGGAVNTAPAPEPAEPPVDECCVCAVLDEERMFSCAENCGCAFNPSHGAEYFPGGGVSYPGGNN
jgi:hypothetical protein